MGVSEETVLKHAFDIVFAFDEVVSFGHRESVTLSQIKTYTEMDSHEEKLAEMIRQSKENEAREMAKKKQMELAKLRASQSKDSMGGGGGSGGPSFGSSSMSNSFQDSMSMSPSPDTGMSSGMSMSTGMSLSMVDDSGPAPLKPNAPKKGMMLGKKKPGDIFAGLTTEPAPAESSKEEVAAQQVAPALVNPLMDPVSVEIDEQVKARLEIEGGLTGEAECVGDFRVTVIDASKADLVCFKLSPQDQSFKYKVHPNLNKASHANNILEFRDETKKYKANMPVPLVKWRLTSANEDFLPITLSCWPSQTAEGTQIVLEFELTDTSVTLEDVHIVFPCPPNARAAVASAEPGQAVFDAGNGQVHWAIPNIDSTESSGTLEFTAAADSASLLPYEFSAIRRGATKCPIEIVECYHQADKTSINYAVDKKTQYLFTVGA